MDRCLMIKPQVIANETTGNILESHTFDIPPCCPVSKNPRPGSMVTISYRPHGCSLEVGSLFAYIHAFRGGLRDEHDNLLVRDMEGMILRIAQDCEQALGVPVQVDANLSIAPRQHVCLSVGELQHEM